MDLKLWAPFMDIDKEWRFDVPRLLREASGFRPSMDVVKTDGHLVVTAELPGISPDDVDVSLDGDILVIKGEKSEEREVSEDDHYMHERTYGSFQRRITVPDGVSADSIEASFDKGILTVEVTLPEVKPAESKRIPVSTK
ncbi:MAG TPA: Hsp20/alpha crystallin family protein [Acidimicrobiia bacterium]|nr:Hsp20/alpha crystallin family protein [Acidimicrobiia bacterium]